MEVGIIYLGVVDDVYMKRKIFGFTLIELLVAVSIIGVIVTIGIASFATLNRQSHDAKRKSDIEQIRSALEMYRADNKFYPDGGCASTTCLAIDIQELDGALGDYMPALPKDPIKTQTYYYRAEEESDGEYYGYCLSANVERDIPTETCEPDNDYNWGIRNP